MDLGDVTAGERNDRRSASVRSVRIDHDGSARSLCLGQRVGKIGNLQAGYFAPVRIRKMPVGGQHGYLAEVGFDPDATIGIVRPADLDARSTAVIGNDLSLREGDKVADKRVGALARHIDPVFRNSLKLRVI